MKTLAWKQITVGALKWCVAILAPLPVAKLFTRGLRLWCPVLEQTLVTLFIYLSDRFLFSFHVRDDVWFLWPLKSVYAIEFGIPYAILVLAVHGTLSRFGPPVSHNSRAGNGESFRVWRVLIQGLRWFAVVCLPVPVILLYWRGLHALGIPGSHVVAAVALGPTARQWAWEGVYLTIYWAPYGVLSLLTYHQLWRRPRAASA